jgi:hypothetical protein
MSRRQHRFAATLAVAVAVAVAVPLAACGSRDDAGTASSSQNLALGTDALFARCRGGRVTTVTDPQGDSVAQTAIGDDGRRVPPPRSKSSTVLKTRAVDLTRAAIQVSAGVMCLTVRGADRAGAEVYILRLASNTSSGHAIPSVLEIVPGTRGVLWHPGGVAEAEETALAYAYRRRGSTISVALRVDDAFPRGIQTAGVSFTDFRWRVQSRSEPVIVKHVVRVAVDCVPDSVWTSYPTGARVGSPLSASEVRSLRCPTSG